MVIYATPQNVADYMGIPLVDLPSDINRLIDRATDLVDYCVMNRIRTFYLNDDKTEIADETTREYVQKATSSQVEYYINNGEQTDEAQVTGISGFAVGNFNMQLGGNTSTQILPIVAPRCKRYLFLAGLLYRGVN